MQLFYTGATTFQQDQKIGYLSLGGFISSSLVANDDLNSIFGAISEYGKSQKKPEYRAIALYNDGDVTITNLKVWIESLVADNSDVIDIAFSKLMIGYAPVQTDDCGDLYVEKLPTITSKPYSVSFVSAEGELNALSLPDIEAGMYLGIFLSRTILASANEELTDDEYCDVSENQLSLAQEEVFEIHFSFDP